jgi:hypothetical protein
LLGGDNNNDMGSPSLIAVANKLAKRFPVAGYGWGNAARHGRLVKVGRSLVLCSAPANQQYDCMTASMAAKAVIKKEGFDAIVLHLEIPIGEDGALEHNLVEVRDFGNRCTLVGFTPIDKLLGISPLRHFSKAAYEKLTGNCNGLFFGLTTEPGDPELYLDELHYPFRARQEGERLVLTEISYRSGLLSQQFQLRGTFLRFDAANSRLVEESPLEATYSLNRWRKSLQFYPDFWQEISANHRRWSFSPDFSPQTLNRPWSILKALREDWPDFSRLIAQAL